MTAPLAPSPPLVVLIVGGVIVVAIAMPVARRDDWIGWIAVLAIAAAAVGLWGILIWSGARTLLTRRRKSSSSD